MDVCLSHQIGQLGLLERENAAILNAALLPLARRVVAQCEQAVRDAGVQGPLYFTANDGTLLSARDALQASVGAGWVRELVRESVRGGELSPRLCLCQRTLLVALTAQLPSTAHV